MLAVEVDAWQFHKEGTKQYERDRMKDAVLERCGLPLLRLQLTAGEGSTTWAQSRECWNVALLSTTKDLKRLSDIEFEKSTVVG